MTWQGTYSGCGTLVAGGDFRNDVNPRPAWNRYIRMKIVLLGIGVVVSVAALLVACGATRAGYESAAYTVKKDYGSFELRDYPSMTVAATQAGGGAGKDERFMRLFRYISGTNADKKKIAMTTPVFMDQAAERQEMMFVLPKDLTGRAPASGGEDVNIKTIPARTMAVLRYHGTDSRELEKSMEQKLRSALAAAGMKTAGEALFAYYDPPWTPSFARRNEVLIPVE